MAKLFLFSMSDEYDKFQFSLKASALLDSSNKRAKIEADRAGERELSAVKFKPIFICSGIQKVIRIHEAFLPALMKSTGSLYMIYFALIDK